VLGGPMAWVGPASSAPPAGSVHTGSVHTGSVHTRSVHTGSAEEPAARLTLTSVLPDLLLVGSTLRVTGQIRNDGPTSLPDVEIRLRAVGPRLGTRGEVGRWLDGEDLREGVPVGSGSRLPDAVPPGGRAPFTLQVPARALGLPGPEFGVFPIAVEALAKDETGARERVALLRTSVQAQPRTKAYTEQRVTWVVPLTGLPGTAIPAGSTPEQVVAKVAHEVGPGSRLSRSLDGALAPGVVWAVDPQLIVTLQEAAREDPVPPGSSRPSPAAPAGSASSGATSAGTDQSTGAEPGAVTASPGNSPTPTQRSADRVVIADFLAQLRAEARKHEVIALPYADPDLQVLSENRAIGLATAGRAAGEGVVEGALGVSATTDIAWPATGQADDPAVRDLADQGYRAVLLDGRTRPLVEALNYTPDARTTTLPGGVVGLLGDPELSAVTASLRVSDVAARSRLMAETAAMTTERPGLSRRLVVVVPRSLVLDGAAFRSAVAGSAETPWLRPVPLADVVEPIGGSGDAAELSRQTLPMAASNGVRTDDVRWVIDRRRRLSAFGEIVEQPVEATARLQRDTLEIVSSGWQGNRPDLKAQQRTQDRAVRSVVEQVGVLPTTITFLRNSGELQLTVSNGLDQRVDGVRLKVWSTDARLVVGETLSQRLTLEPGTRATVRVPVTALASGQVRLQAQLLAPSGGPVGRPEQVRVRVRPTDSWVITAGGVLAGLVLVVGLVRAVRRPRQGSGEPSR
jgi:hypothetical protein